MSSHNTQRLKLIYQNWRHLAKSNNTKESGKTFIPPLILYEAFRDNEKTNNKQLSK